MLLISKPSPIPLSRTRSGASLVLVLAALAIISFLAIVILTFSRSETRSARTTADLVRVRMLADLPEKLVISQIRRATKGLQAGYTWTSQPGMIRVFGTEVSDGLPRADADEFYKLYSAKTLTLPGNDPSKLSEDTTEFAAVNWQKKPVAGALYADLNEPVVVLPPLKQGQVQSLATTAVYPIFDPAAIGVVDGCDYDVGALKAARVNAHPYPMPVRWLYVLRDGTLVAAEEKNDDAVLVDGATKDNPIVGRIAYWTDDESCKLNINTATEPAPWEAPHTHTTADEAYAKSMPAKGEFYRMSGHPAFTSLAPALRNLGKPPGDPTTPSTPEREPPDPLDNAQWWQHLVDYHHMLPRTFYTQTESAETGSSGGTKVPEEEVKTKQERLFATVDELFFTPDRAKNVLSNNLPDEPTQQNLRMARFVLTTHSRAPELNPFNRPKISLWPVQEDITKRNEIDKRFVAASTVGRTPYYLQRASAWEGEGNPGSSQSQDEDMAIADNLKLFRYLMQMTTTPGSNQMTIPGFGKNFFNLADPSQGKYKIESYDQLLASMFDMIRWGVNPATPYNQQIETQLSPQYSYLPPGFGQTGTARGIGGWSAIPLRATGYGENVDSRMLTPSDTVTQWARGYGRFPTIIEAAIVFVPTDVDPAPGPAPYQEFAARTKALQAFLIIQPHVSAVGVPSLSPAFEYQVTGLNNFSVGNGVVGGVDIPLNMPPIAESIVSLSPLNPASAQPSSNSSAHVSLAAQFLQSDGTVRTQGTTDPETEFPFVSTMPAILDTPLTPTLGRAGTLIHFSGGTIQIQIKDSTTGFTSQALEFHFPPTEIPTPLLAITDLSRLANKTAREQMDDRLTPTEQDTPGSLSKMGNLILRGDVVRGVGVHGEPVRMFPPPSVPGPVLTPVAGITRGDFRLLAGRAAAPHPEPSTNLEFFAPHPLYGEPTPVGAEPVDAPFKATSLRDGPDARTVFPRPSLVELRQLVARLDQNDAPVAVAPNGASIPAVPNGTLAALNLDNRPGDFDTGPGIIEDGPYINMPDFNNVANESAGVSGWFKRGGGFTEEDGITFSPWRQAGSAVMFGSLPTGVYGTAFDVRPQPWQTLLFCPNPASRSTAQSTLPGDEPGWVFGTAANLKKDHFGFATPRDHLWLEFFRMPAVEPEGFADNVSTEGKVNMNYQLMPFTWVKRSTAMMGALHGVRITAIPTTAMMAGSAVNYKEPDPTKIADLQFRYEVDAAKTLEAFEERFNGVEAKQTKPDVFRSPSEICEMWLVPKRIKDHFYTSGTVTPQDPAAVIGTYKDTLDWWEGQSRTDPTDGFEATGDNLREAPYAQLYPRLCTRSNVFTVHYRVQVLDKSRSTAPNVWDINKDNVVADYRGQTTVERYLDQDDPDLAAKIPDFRAAGNETQALDDYYRIRVLNRRVFAP